jgi:hypothetical protein
MRQLPPDEDVLDIQQAFVEARAELDGTVLSTRVGRQEMALGRTARWVSLRDGLNIRQAFDLVRLTTNGARWSNDTFFGTVPDVQRGMLDDAPFSQNRFWGSYWTLDVVPDRRLSVELFYLGRARPAVRYGEIGGREIRHMIGTRVDGTLTSGLEYAGHALVQTGTVGDASTLAWGFAGAILQRLPGFLSKTLIGIRGDALSGDGRIGDNRVGTLHPFFPAPQFFGALGAIYASNLYEFHPLAQLRTDTVTMEAGCAFFWRQSTEDAVYTPPGAVLVSPAISHAAFTASQASLTFGHVVSRHVSFNADYSHAFVSSALLAATTRDIDYFGTWTTFTY